MSDWTADSNEALMLSLVRSEEDKTVLGKDECYEGFNPTFTYPIYGEEEKIYGYKDLVIDLRFASGSLAQSLSVEYSSKLPSTSTVDDVEGTLKKFIPEGYYTNEDDFLKRVDEDATAFKPPGKKIYEYTRRSPSASGKGKGVALDEALDPEDEDTVVFEVYHATWDTPGFREYHRRMQLFILLYIEGGSYIQEDEDSWEFVVLFERRNRRDSSKTPTYHFVGYSSLFAFYHFPEKLRMRLSQFVILSPYQRQGHGSALYNAIYTHIIIPRPDIAELTVEDPAEAFEDLRDRNDLKYLLAHEKFMREAFGDGGMTASAAGGKIGGVRLGGKGKSKVGGWKAKMGPPVDKAWRDRWRVELKIASRQFHRLVEMLQLLHLDPTDIRSAKAYRLQVKERLYRFNFEVLMQLEKEERLEKLEETFQSVKEDYQRILAMMR